MISESAFRGLSALLFPDDRPVYAVVDGAGCSALLPMIARHGVPHVCLYRGELEPDLLEAAPHLVVLGLDDPFTRWLLTEGWDRHWCMTLRADAALSDMRGHLRRLTTARLPDGRVVYFRFHDPRVARVYLPTCDATEIKRFFGPIDTIVIEDERPATALSLTPSPEGVAQARVPLAG